MQAGEQAAPVQAVLSCAELPSSVTASCIAGISAEISAHKHSKGVASSILHALQGLNGGFLGGGLSLKHIC